MSEFILREPREDECEALTELCLRSKAHWGYSEAFMQACRDELAVTPVILHTRFCRLAEGEAVLGYVEVSLENTECYLEKLFVEPAAMGRGVGRQLMESAIAFGRNAGMREMTIEADPDAAPFYRKLDARDAGHAPSGSIPGRNIPRLTIAL